MPPRLQIGNAADNQHAPVGYHYLPAVKPSDNSAAFTTSPGLERFLATHESLIETLHRNSAAARWGVTRERLAQALHRSAERRFTGLNAGTAEVASYLQSLHLEDLALACACCDGSEKAWEYFVERYRADLHAAARAIIRTGGDARVLELADSLYAELYGLEERRGSRRSLFAYFHGRSKLSTWLRAVMAQRHIDTLRASQRTESLEEQPEVVDGPAHLGAAANPPDPDRARYLGLLQAALLAAVAALDGGERLRLAYYYVHEKTLAEIGRILGEHEATVSRKLERLRSELREQVETQLRDKDHLSQAQIELCIKYATEECPFDLTKALSVEDRRPDGAASQIECKIYQSIRSNEEKA